MGVIRRSPPPDTVPARAAAYGVDRVLVASAQQIALKDPKEVQRIKSRRQSAAWQDDCWEYFDAIGEIKYAFNLMGNVCSRVRLFPGMVESLDEPPVSVKDSSQATDLGKRAATDAISRLNLGAVGLTGMLRTMSINLQVCGECYLVQTPANPLTRVGESWDIRSVNEVSVDNSGKKTLINTTRGGANTASSGGGQVLPTNAFIARIWRQHPRYSDEADSSLLALRDACDDLLLYTRSGRAVARSRLNAGMLFLPDGLSVSSDEQTDENFDTDTDVDPLLGGAEDEDAFEEELVQSMLTPISDEESASAVVPLIVRGPGEMGAQIKLFSFERAFDPEIGKRADNALERILNGLDVPKEMISGLDNVRFSNAIVIDEALYRAHIEPLLVMICDALTVAYFRPALVAAGLTEDEAQRYVIWYDPTEILTRPDRGEDANDGFDRMVLSDKAWRASHGYTEADAPTQEELMVRLALTRGQLSPELTEALFKLVNPELMQQMRAAAQANSPTGPLSERAQEILNGINPGSASRPNGTPGTPAAPPAPTAPTMPGATEEIPGETNKPGVQT